MGNYEELKTAIQKVIRTNGNNEITGAVLQNALLSIIDILGANATFAGVATPNTDPGRVDQNVFYLATEAGTYVNFRNIEVEKGEAVILSNKTGNWVKTTSGFATQQHFTELETEVDNIKKMVESGAGGSGDGNINIQGGGMYLLKYLEYPNTSGLSEEDKADNIQIYNAVKNGTLDRPIATYKDGIYSFVTSVMDDDDGSLILTEDYHFTSPLEEDMAANKSSLYITFKLKENGEAFVTSFRIEDSGDGESGNDEVTEVLTIYAISMMWDLSPSMLGIPEEPTEDDMELLEPILAIFANNASVYNKIMISDTPAKSYPVVIDYLLDSINGEGWCRTIIPAVLVKSLEGFRIIPADEYKSYIELIELPDFGYTISEDGGYSRKSSMIMFAIQDTGVIHESLVQQNARVAKLLLYNQVNSSNVNIFFGTSSLFNAYAGEDGGVPGMSVVYMLMKLFLAYNSARGKIMAYQLDGGDGAGITNEIHVSVPGAIAKFDPYSSSPTFIPVVEFQQTNN